MFLKPGTVQGRHNSSKYKYFGQWELQYGEESQEFGHKASPSPVTASFESGHDPAEEMHSGPP